MLLLVFNLILSKNQIKIEKAHKETRWIVLSKFGVLQVNNSLLNLAVILTLQIRN